MTQKTYLKVASVFALLFVQVVSTSNASATVACANELGGSYTFGVAPNFCNVSAFSTAALTKAQYSPVIYNDSKAAATEREAYMSSLYPAFRDVVKYYIKRRNPSVSAAEEEGFLAGTYALATQESVWSHYRVGSDKIYRYMRGDSLHGYGFMQLDDRSHASQISKGVGEDMVENMLAGLDIYYAAWIQAKTARCISSASDYKSRARAAWAAYNGGPGSICRWTKTNTHDTEYLGNYTSQRWLSVVKDTGAASPLNVTCLAEGTRPCALPGAAPVAAPAKPAPVASTPAAPALKQAVLSAQYPYRVLRSCGAVSCEHVSGAIMGGETVNVVSQPAGEWTQISSVKDGHQGWLKTADLEGMN